MSEIKTDIDYILADWREFLNSERRYSQKTIQSYQEDISLFRKFLIDNYNIHENDRQIKQILQNLEYRDFRKFVSYIADDRNASSVARIISSLKNFYRFLRNRKNIENEYIFSLKSPKKDKNLPRAISEESVFDSIEEIENIEFFKNNSEEWVSVRDKLLLSLIYSCGLRISEAINLNYDDINFKSQFVRIKGKGDKERIVPIIADILESIEHLCKLCPYFDKSKKIIFYGKQGDRLHPTVFQKTLREVKKILNLPEGTTPHAFRHSFATHLLSSSKDLLSIKELMGHSSISTTQKYTKIEASDMLSAFSEMD